MRKNAQDRSSGRFALHSRAADLLFKFSRFHLSQEMDKLRPASRTFIGKMLILNILLLQ